MFKATYKQIYELLRQEKNINLSQVVMKIMTPVEATYKQIYELLGHGKNINLFQVVMINLTPAIVFNPKL